MSGHVVPVRVYVAIFLALLVLTGVTTWVAYFDMGRLNTVVALAIAVTKMLLVILFFMHVKYTTGLTKIVIISGFFFLAILVALTLSDVLTRGWSPEPSSWSAILPHFGQFF